MKPGALAAIIVAAGVIAAGVTLAVAGGSGSSKTAPPAVKTRTVEKVASIPRPASLRAARYPRPKPKPAAPVQPGPAIAVAPVTPAQPSPPAPVAPRTTPSKPEYGPVVVAPAQ